MITPDYARAMARYNAWMNRNLYESAARLGDPARKRDLGAFFTSLHGTLNHLLLGDRLWMGRFVGEPVEFPSLAHQLYSDFGELTRERAKTDAAIIAYAEALTPARIGETLRYQTMVDPREVTFPLGFALAHFFNHQTHHRGQVTTLLMQLGIDPGVTDLIALPGIERPG